MPKVQVARWGNSTAVRLPKAVVEELGLRPGALLDLVLDGRDIHLRAPSRTSRDLLQELVAEAARLGPEGASEMIDWGPDRGSEIIDDEYSRGEVALDDPLSRRAHRR